MNRVFFFFFYFIIFCNNSSCCSPRCLFNFFFFFYVILLSDITQVDSFANIVCLQLSCNSSVDNCNLCNLNLSFQENKIISVFFLSCPILIIIITITTNFRSALTFRNCVPKMNSQVSLYQHS